MKHCNRCDTTLSKDSFGKNISNSDGLQSQCKQCRKHVNNEQYANNPNRRANIRRNQDKFYKESRDYVNSIKDVSSCAVCGENANCALDFHHFDNNKEFGVSENIGRFSLTRLKVEISKCIILCANCHRKVHARLLIL